MSCKPAILLIGGLDPQGMSGITADTQTVTTHGCHPVPLITSLTEQTSQGLTRKGALSKEQFIGQYQSCVTDFAIAAIKIGFIPNIAIAMCISDIIDKHDVPVIFDPVFNATYGGQGSDIDLPAFIMQTLLTKITLLMPNLPELAILMQADKVALNDFASITRKLLSKGLNACLVKGGHADSSWATDYFDDGDKPFYCYQKKQSGNVRGTGCILASSIASRLALGKDMHDAYVLARAHLNRGIKQAEKLGCYHVFKHDIFKLQLQDLPKLCYNHSLIGNQFNFANCPQKLGIYPVVDTSNWVGKLVKEGINTIQLRIKDKSGKQIQQEVNKAVKFCRRSAKLFINDYWQMAINYNAYGVHLGQNDLNHADLRKIEQAGLRLGVSTHSYWELARTLTIKPSYIAFGPVFATTSKQMSFSPQGIDEVTIWARLLGDAYPLVAIGGINQARATLLKQTGVGGIAMISAITKAYDYKKATQALIDCWQGS